MDIDRRTLPWGMLSGAAIAGPDPAAAEAQGGAQSDAPDPSVYVPKAHLVEDRAFLHAFMDFYKAAPK